MLNGIGVTESIVHARGPAYAYRTAMGMIGSAEFCVVMHDFMTPVASNFPQGWTGAVIDTGATAVVSTTAGSLGATGSILIASDGTSEGVAIYGDKEIQLTSTKRFFMEMRAQVNLAATTTLQFGLTDLTATTNPEDLWTTTAANLVAFGTLSGSATGKPELLADKSNSGSTAEAGTMTISDATWTTLGISYDGTYLRGYVDGQQSLLWSQASTTIPTGVALAPFFGFLTGTSASNIGTIDYVRWAIER